MSLQDQIAEKQIQMEKRRLEMSAILDDMKKEFLKKAKEPEKVEEDGYYFSEESRNAFLKAREDIQQLEEKYGKLAQNRKLKREFEDLSEDEQRKFNSDKMCSICMEEYVIGNMKQQVVGNICQQNRKLIQHFHTNLHSQHIYFDSLLDCNHRFHYKCLKEWYKFSRVCPLCKAKIEDVL